MVVQRSLHYAKEQRKWIKNKFLVRRVGLPLFFLEATDGKYNTSSCAVTFNMHKNNAVLARLVIAPFLPVIADDFEPFGEQIPGSEIFLSSNCV